MLALQAIAAASPSPAPHIGRPTKFTPETQAILLEYITGGYTLKMACEAADLDYGTYALWQRDAQDPSSIYFAFFQQLTRARLAAKKKLVDEWHAAGQSDWRAKAKYLAILDPEDFSEQRQLHVHQSGTVTHVHTLAAPSEGELDQLAGLLGLPEPIDGTARALPDPDDLESE